MDIRWQRIYSEKLQPVLNRIRGLSPEPVDQEMTKFQLKSRIIQAEREILANRDFNNPEESAAAFCALGDLARYRWLYLESGTVQEAVDFYLKSARTLVTFMRPLKQLAILANTCKQPLVAAALLSRDCKECVQFPSNSQSESAAPGDYFDLITRLAQKPRRLPLGAVNFVKSACEAVLEISSRRKSCDPVTSRMLKGRAANIPGLEGICEHTNSDSCYCTCCNAQIFGWRESIGIILTNTRRTQLDGYLHKLINFSLDELLRESATDAEKVDAWKAIRVSRAGLRSRFPKELQKEIRNALDRADAMNDKPVFQRISLIISDLSGQPDNDLARIVLGLNEWKEDETKGTRDHSTSPSAAQADLRSPPHNAILSALFPSSPPRLGAAAEILRAVRNPKPTVLIDGMNVALGHTNGESFSVNGLLIAVNFFESKGHKVCVILPTRRFASDRQPPPDVASHFRPGQVMFTPSYDYDDSYILTEALAVNGWILSRDRYRDWLPKQRDQGAALEWLENSVISFSFREDRLIVNADFFSRKGLNEYVGWF